MRFCDLTNEQRLELKHFPFWRQHPLIQQRWKLKWKFFKRVPFFWLQL